MAEMGKYGIATAKVITTIAFGAFILAGLWLWDYSENAYDAKMNQLYNERDVPAYCYLDPPYISSEKTKLLHKLDSDCAKQIIPDDMVIFLSREEATKAGYKPCSVCSP